MHGTEGSFSQALTITAFVFAMMVLVDYVNVFTRGKMGEAIRGGGFRQYLVTSFFGTTPGCLGSFLNVSFYIKGLISFGALAGGMAATCGDEAFVMIALFPGTAMLLFAILFVVGVLSAAIIDKLVVNFKIKTCEECEEGMVHKEEECRCLSIKEVLQHLRKISLARFLLLAILISFLYVFAAGLVGPEWWNWKRITFVGILTITTFIVLTVPEHYLKVHIWEHIAKRHLWRIFIWSFAAIFIVNVGFEHLDIEGFVSQNMIWVFFIALLFGFIPQSGPHLIFVMLFANGFIPFSILLASSIAQSGHGLLPLLSHSIKDSVLIKLLNIAAALVIGLTLYLSGL